MADLFDPIRVGSFELANRFVRSATHDFMADESGCVTEAQLELYRKLARGGVGLIVTGHLYVRRDGKCSIGMTAIDSDDKIAGLRRLVQAVRGSGEARIAAQINFGGAQVVPALRSSPLLAPSPREDVPQARAFTAEEAEAIVASYVEAACRAAEAGFDGVQVHAAHGYFVNQTLSPLTNRRTDAYGGDLERRSRIFLSIVAGIRRKLGGRLILLAKLAAHDGQPGGLALEESVEIARRAESLGLEALEVSGGMRPGMNTRRPVPADKEGFFLEEAARFEQALHIPVACVSGWRTLQRMRDAVASGKVDLISLCRPLIREPDLIDRFRSGAQAASTCISCNECLKRQQPLRCWAA